MTNRQMDWILAVLELLGVLFGLAMLFFASITGQVVIAVVLLFAISGLFFQMVHHFARVL